MTADVQGPERLAALLDDIMRSLRQEDTTPENIARDLLARLSESGLVRVPQGGLAPTGSQQRVSVDMANALPDSGDAPRALLAQATEWLDAMAKGKVRDGPSLWQASDFVERARAALGSAPPEPSDEERVLADAVRAAAADTAFVREQYDGVRRVLLRLTQFRTTPPAPSVEPRVVNRSDEEFYRSQLSGIVAQAQGALSQFPELITGSPPPEPWSTQELYHVAAEVRHRGSLDNAVSYLRDALNRVGSAPRETPEDR